MSARTVIRWRVAGLKRLTFDTMAAAVECANLHWRRTGIFVSVEQVTVRVRS